MFSLLVLRDTAAALALASAIIAVGQDSRRTGSNVQGQPLSPAQDTAVAGPRWDSAAVCRRAAALVALLYQPPASDGGFNRGHVRFQKPRAILSYISDSGLAIHDESSQGRRDYTISRRQLDAELRKSVGPTALTLAHLGYYAGSGQSQYSELQCRREGGGGAVSVGQDYVLYFVPQRGAWRLARIAYSNSEVD